ncbi:PREDICTED: AP-4 complex accessory subunit tepsin isoform X5 [Chinchilla lanigera]|uniref:AP-4 complex accessory subunit tepsin isoform X5 n=1 Tax=Chinchilla lanigera TaxID=34839 RepID=UPI00038F18B5|nr:PREDICTED: AP-4 complex accessory subunit tepsin isoform X5 [Chinchilla lanigera]
MIGESGPGGSGPGLGGGVIWTMAASPPLRDRLSFLHRCIPEISHESVGSSQCLLEYLLNRLNSSSGHVKLKVLKILLYLCSHGSSSFLLILRRNCALIQEATVFSGPPDPLHGNSLYQKVRAAAQLRLARRLQGTFGMEPNDKAGVKKAASGSLSPASSLRTWAVPCSLTLCHCLPPSVPGPCPPQAWAPSPGLSAASRVLVTARSGAVQRAAEVVVNAMHPGPENSWTQRPLPQGDTYQPAMTPSGSHSHPAFGNQLPGAIPGARAVRHQPGQAGGGWDELDSSPGSQSSSRNSDRSRASDSGSRSGSDSLSGASREPGDLAERAEAMALSDCQQELSLVRTVTQGPRAFLSREEAQHFIKECGLLNCEAVLELLLCQLGTASELEQMRALCAIASLGSTDLLPQEHILLLSRRWLQELSMGSPGPVTSKATKILRHFEASCGQRPLAPKPCAESSPAATLEGPSDLLTGPVPPSGAQVFLQPLSSTPVLPGSPAPTPAPDTSPLPTPGLNLAETPPAASREQGAQSGQGLGDTDTPGGGPSHCPWSRDSLFAGMELVACPRLVGVQATAEEPNRGPHIPQTWAERAAATEPPGPELSAFAFLNK